MPVAERSVRLSRHFYRITVANGIFTLAQSLFSLVVTVLIYETTGSALNVGLAFAISLIPNGIGFLTRVNRNTRLMPQYRRVTLLAALTTVLAGMALLIRLHWALFLVVFLLGSLMALGEAIQMALIPTLTPDLDRANSVNYGAATMAQLIGFSGGPLLLKQTHRLPTVAVTLLLFLITWTLLWPSNSDGFKQEPTSDIGDEAHGPPANVYRLVWEHPALRYVTWWMVPHYLGIGIYNALAVVLIFLGYHGHAWAYGFLGTAEVLGMTLGSAVTTVRPQWLLRRGLVLILSLAGTAVGVWFVAHSPTIWIAILWGFPAGFINVFSVVVVRGLVQETTPAEVHAAVFSLRLATTRVAEAGGGILGGLVVTEHLLGIRGVYTLGALAIACAAIVALANVSVFARTSQSQTDRGYGNDS